MMWVSEFTVALTEARRQRLSFQCQEIVCTYSRVVVLRFDSEELDIT